LQHRDRSAQIVPSQINVGLLIDEEDHWQTDCSTTCDGQRRSSQIEGGVSGT
jgi:hypothetical protein